MKERSISSTDATVVDLAEDLAGFGVWDVDGCDFPFSGLAYAFLDVGLLELGDAWLVG